MKIKIKPFCLLLAAALCLGGCTMSADYTRPEAPIPATLPGNAALLKEDNRQIEMDLASIPWRDFFIDEQLQALITLALENNRDLRIAALNIERSRNLYRIQRANLLPRVDAGVQGSKQKVPESLSSTGRSAVVEQYRADLGISGYELDLFGRIQSLKDQALEQYLATEQAQLSIKLGLVAEVATAYLTLVADLERLSLSRETLKNQEAFFRLIELRLAAGASSELDLWQAQTRLDAARVDIARFSTLAAQDKNALTLITGSTVPATLLPQGLSETVTMSMKIAPGLPSDVLLRRPDVVEAEHLLKGLNANIGAARAAFFPRITLVGSVGFGSDELSGLFKSGSDAWSFIPRIDLPIFDAGNRRANLKVAKVDRDIAVMKYEKTIQTAFRDVADALARKETIDEEVAAQQSLTDAAEKSYTLSMARYDKGVDSYLSVLDSQRSLYSARQDLIAARLTRLINQTVLYKALGGGTN